MDFERDPSAAKGLLILTVMTAASFIAGCASTSACKVDGPALSAFQARMLTAINANKQYPQQPDAIGPKGIVTVSFDYTDGDQAKSIRVYKSSGNTYLDAAAIGAVVRTLLPPKPCGFEEIKHYIVSVNFY